MKRVLKPFDQFWLEENLGGPAGRIPVVGLTLGYGNRSP